MNCRIGCGACCIAPSISSAIPGMPNGKPAGVRCPNLTDDNICRLWGGDQYPDVCRKFQPQLSVCGSTNDQALALINALEIATTPEVTVR